MISAAFHRLLQRDARRVLNQEIFRQRLSGDRLASDHPGIEPVAFLIAVADNPQRPFQVYLIFLKRLRRFHARQQSQTAVENAGVAHGVEVGAAQHRANGLPPGL